jgi:lipoyl(octanoyl) transferase
MKFRLIDSKDNTSSMNMAIDEALLTSKKPVLRFYSWNPAGLSLGYFQNTQVINLIQCKKLKVDVVRRLTGGNAVLHDKELTYSLVIDENKMPKSIVESYKVISSGLLEGLKNLGLKAVMNSEVSEGQKSAVCFNDPSWYEMVVNNKKIVGSAQKRIDGKILQHGAVLIDADVKKYCSLFNNCSSELIMKVKKRMTSINDELKEGVSYSAVALAMRKGFEKALGIEFEESELTEKEKELAKKLERNKYSKDVWNLRR